MKILDDKNDQETFSECYPTLELLYPTQPGRT
jgi:hypothetical protein